MSQDYIAVPQGRRRGVASVPFSKSHLHRLLIADFLAGGRMYLEDLGRSADIQATRRCLKALAEARGSQAVPVLDCGESGSTLRFMLPLAMALVGSAEFTAAGRLPERPVAPFIEILARHGVMQESKPGAFPLRLSGRLSPGAFSVQVNISSQIVTGLLFSLPLLDGDSTIQCTAPLESRGYIDMTMDALAAYGVEVHENNGAFRIPGRQRYSAGTVPEPELDWSGAAFWLAMNALGSKISVPGLNPLSRQPDMAIRDMAGGWQNPVDVSQCPDLFPVLAVLAAARDGRSVFTGVRRLRLKESDRLAAMVDMLKRLGVDASMEENAFAVEGRGLPLRGGVEINSFNDHRIAMAAAVAATVADAPICIQGPECVSKSYPGFFEQLSAMEIIR